MIAAIIHWSIRNRLLVLLLTAFLVAGGVYSLRNIPVDAIPDLSDVQVIIKTSYPGQAPQVVEDPRWTASSSPPSPPPSAPPSTRRTASRPSPRWRSSIGSGG